MSPEQEKLRSDLRNVVSGAKDRATALQQAANLIRAQGSYRWIGLYTVDHSAGLVRNITWCGPGAPEYPTFPMTKGLTGAAITGRQIVNVGDVSADPRYLTAFGNTRSEIIVPIFDQQGETVVGTIDIESEDPNAFNADVEAFLTGLFRGDSTALGELRLRGVPILRINSLPKAALGSGNLSHLAGV
jgi:L-methionine (R)-S-oxide reductase